MKILKVQGDLPLCLQQGDHGDIAFGTTQLCLMSHEYCVGHMCQVTLIAIIILNLSKTNLMQHFQSCETPHHINQVDMSYNT